MAKIQKTVEVSKEMSELGDSLAGLVKSIKEKSKDGLSVTEIVGAVGEQMNALVAGVVGLEQLPAEAKEDLQAFSLAVALPLCEILGSVAGKSEAPVPSA